MMVVTSDMQDQHQFPTFEDAEAAATGWIGAEIQQVTFNGLNPEPRTVYTVTLPYASRPFASLPGEWRMGWLREVSA